MSTTTVTDALARALTRVEAGASIATALGECPEHADALRPLLAAALFVREQRPRPSTAFRAAVHQRLAEEPVPARGGRFGRGLANGSGRAPWVRWSLRAAAVAVAVVVSFSGLAVASANSRPGDLLYPVRRGVQHIQDVAEKVAPPIGRAIDYLTIREVPDAGASATPSASPTLALAPGSSVLNARRRAGRSGEADRTSDGDATSPAIVGPERRVPEPGPRAANGTVAKREPNGGAENPPAILNPPATPVGPPTAVATPAQRPTPMRSPSPPVPEATDLPALGGVSGQVLSEEHAREHDRTEIGLAGALVSVYPVSPEGVPLWGSGRHMRTRLDGTYSFVELAPGSYKLAVGEIAPWVWRRWYRDTTNFFAAVPIEVRSGAMTAGIDMRLRRHPWFMGFDPSAPWVPGLGR